MEQWEREFYVARIIAGKICVRIDGVIFSVVAPTREQKFTATEVYRNTRRDAELEGVLNDQELLEILIKQGVWTEKDADQMEKLTKAVEDLKVGLFENRFRSNARLSIRTALRKTKDELSRLELLRHGLEYVTLDGLALAAKYRYLVGVTIRPSDIPDNSIVDRVMEVLSQERLEDKQYRELARTDPWRSIWGLKGHSGRGVFDCAAVELTDEQRNLMVWSSVYDNIREYPDCPNDDVIEDDDMLDGWMIIHRRQRESQAASQEAERIGNEKIRKADEQYIFVDTLEDAREVEKMNDPMAAMTKKQRFNFLKQKGEVNEVYMPDTAQKIRMELNRLEQIKIRQGK